MISAILGTIAAIAILCWLLFTLAIYALPTLGGVAAGTWLIGPAPALRAASPSDLPPLAS